ncbi:MAG TPA: methylated-DNA--[protein]-cysteine S-methyltransferase [Caulobacteraceae bacterium]|jgi:AraC family transcriptional regulator of adaptative response/methylated-DNA-[protein]-cysteine methyltransferase|nr:methylated-DNA--[protein]-cysteine S-methyltransferase [Caulobacteraceae bacterium]
MTYLSDQSRWDAVQRRERAADGAFVFAVKTTGVYCRPTCAGRPLRANVAFFDTPEAARAAGFRACKRCRPDEARERLRYSIAPCDLGSMLVCVSDAGLRAVLLGDDPAALRRDLEARFPKALIAEARLDAEVAAVRSVIASPGAPLNLPLDVRGGELAQAVWTALMAIPAGETASYADLARAIGRPRAARAVAQACAANPLPVVVPCHRVVRADGSLSGYRWGVARKQALIAREAAA